MVAYLRVVEGVETEDFQPAQAARSGDSQGDPSLRLMRAFRKISDEEDRMKIVRIAEALGDPIWDY